MTLQDKQTVKTSQRLPGEAYLLRDSHDFHEVPKSVSLVLHASGFDMYSYATDCESFHHEVIRYTETLIRCSLNEIAASLKPFVIQLEAGLRKIFICFADREERDDCFTKILASVGQFLVLNPRSRKSLLGKRASNPLSPVSPLSVATGPTLKEEQLSLLLNALDISSSPRCIANNRPNSPFSFKFPALLVSICNSKPRRAKEMPNTKLPVARSYTLPFSKYGTTRSCKQFSAWNSVICDNNNTRTSLETRAALGILNTDLGDVRQYLSRL